MKLSNSLPYIKVLESRPARARGLKLASALKQKRSNLVAPRAGAWIETRNKARGINNLRVAPRAGAWIETNLTGNLSLYVEVAPRAGAWIETRKEVSSSFAGTCRAPRGRVD